MARVLGPSIRTDCPDVQPAAISAIPRGILADAARFHGVAGYVHRFVAPALGSDDEVVRDLDALRFGALEHHLRGLADLRVLRDVFTRAGIDWLLVKGPVLAAVHERADLRAYSDLDVVVPAGSFARALDALEESGATVAVYNWWHRLDRLSGEVPLILPSGTVVDLHWHLLNDVSVREAFALDMATLFDRAREIDLHTHRVATFDEPDTLLYAALHTALSGANRLIWLKDLELLANSETIDWDVVAARSRASRLELVTTTMLAKAQSIVGLRLPSDAGGVFASNRVWRGVAKAATLVDPPARTRGGRSLDRIVSRSTRADLPNSLRELARKATKVRPGPHDESTFAARDREGSVSAAEGRRAYLDVVTRQL